MRPLPERRGHVSAIAPALASRRTPLDAARKADQFTHGTQVAGAGRALKLLHERVDVACPGSLILTPHGRVRQCLARLGFRRAANASDLSEPETTGMLSQCIAE
jgi:hypothetical protein